jgi:hypothetical protein
MKSYSNDSPESLARVLAMAIVSDGSLDARELTVLDDLEAYALLGMDRSAFLRVARDFCGDLARREGDSISLLAPDVFDPVVNAVTRPEHRKLIARLLIAVVGADQLHAQQERTLVNAVLRRWKISLEELAQWDEMDAVLKAVAG